VFTHGRGGGTGMTEVGAGGDCNGPGEPVPPPADNLAFHTGSKPVPKSSAPFTSPVGKGEMGKSGRGSFTPRPHNRWTSYESPNASDWLAIDFDTAQKVGRVELALYDDRGGVQAPASYAVQFWDGEAWREVKDAKHSPEQPAGGQFNEVRFAPVE